MREIQQPAQREHLPRLLIDELSVALVGGVVVRPRGELEQVHRFGVEHVRLTAPPPVIEAAVGQQNLLLGRGGFEALEVLVERFAGNFIEPQPADAGNRAAEISIHHGLVDAQNLKHLRAVVALQSRNAHLRENLQQAVAHGFDVVVGQLRLVQRGSQVAGLAHGAHGGQRQVGVDGRGPERQQTGEMVHFPHVAGFHHQAHRTPETELNQVMMHGRHGQQRRNGRVLRIHGAVRQNQHLEAVIYRVFGVAAEAGEAALQRAGQAVGLEIRLQGLGIEHAGVDAAQLFQLVVAQDGLAQGHAVAVVLVLVEDVAVVAQERGQTHHQPLPDGVDGRVGDLREKLLEVAAQVLRLVRKHGQRHVHAHRADGFLGLQRHRRNQCINVLAGVAEHLVVLENRVGGQIGEHLARLGQLFEANLVLVQPRAVGLAAGGLGLQFLVGDDAAGHGIYQQHFAGLQAAFLHHGGRVDVQYTGFGGHQHAAVGGFEVAQGTQAVAVEHGSNLLAIGENERGRAVPGLHKSGVKLVEGLFQWVHLGVAVPGFGHQHHHHVRQRAARVQQDFHHVVEAGRVRLPGIDYRQQHVHFLGREVGRYVVAQARVKPVQIPA